MLRAQNATRPLSCPGTTVRESGVSTDATLSLTRATHHAKAGR